MPRQWNYTTLQPDERPTSEAAARDFVNEVRLQWGFYDADDEAAWQAVPEKLRKQYDVLRARTRENAAGHTQLAASGLYTSRYRFIHEIIQNADDANYGTSVPHLRATVHQDKIIFESNEQGFTAKDVAALCDVGQSSKAGDETTTGEKGLGFKSVFGVANQVHIESGYWSISFVHNEGDDGLGMVVPLWVGLKNSSQAPVEGTKLSLHYATPTDKFLTKLVSVVQDITQDFILALKRLRKLTLDLSNVQGGTESRTFERMPDVEGGSVTIRSTTQDDSSTAKFLTFKTILTEMPKSHLRPRESTEVMLAFQVNDNDEPELPTLGNFIYSTLPIRRMPNLRFIVNADFTLLPNRENLNDSAWNQHIVSSIPGMFTEALSHFQKYHEALTYTWFEYLPRSPVGEEDCWTEIREDLFFLLSQMKSVRSRRLSTFKRPKDVRLLPEIFCDDDDNPLFEDLQDEDIYLSSEYDQKYFELLKQLGVQELSSGEMYSRIEADIKSSSSIIKQRPYRHDWHMRFLTLVDEISTIEHLRKKARDLTIIPLCDDTWVAPNDGGTIYLPYVELDDGEQIELPSNLRLRKLHPEACTADDPDFERLYCSLGVSRVTSEDVVRRIKLVHQSFQSRSDQTKAWRLNGKVEDWIWHFEILFWQGFAASGQTGIKLSGLSDACKILHASRLYLRSEAPYHAFSLLKNAKDEDDILKQGYGFIHERYNKSKMQNVVRNKYTWTAWLEKVAGFQSYPPLIETTSTSSGTKYSLHPQMRYVANHRDDFIHTLHAHWHKSYGKYISAIYKDVVEQISEVTVRCQNGTYNKLRHCILSTQEIMILAKKYSVEKDLSLLSPSTDFAGTNQESWNFLQSFGVVCGVDKKLYIEILKAIVETGEDDELIIQQCTDIYGRLLKCCSLEDRDWLLEQLEDIKGIIVPNDEDLSVQALWTFPSDCVWDAPRPLESKQPLRARYNDLDVARRFFQGLLGLPNATSDDIMEDIKNRSNLSDPDENEREVSCELYEALFAFTSDANELKKIRLKFHEDALIFVSGSWYKASDCIWSGHVSALKALDRQYPDLRSFFVDQLGIRVLSCKVILAELTKACDKGSCDAAHFKDLLITLGQIMSTSKDREAIKEKGRLLRNSKFLPIRNSSDQLMDMTDEFYIVDNESFGNAFHEHVPVLNFSLNQLTIVEPIFHLFDLSGRYLSRNVKTQVRVTDSRLNAKLSEHFRYRAYALSCHEFLQPNKRTYSLILQCNVYTCKDLETYLVVQHNGKDISVKSNRPAIGLKVESNLLVMHAPHDTEELVATVRTDLPKQLMKLLGITNPDAERQIYRILTEDDERLEEVLDQENLPEVTWLPPPQPRQQEITALSSGNIDQLQRVTAAQENLPEATELPPPQSERQDTTVLSSGIIDQLHRVNDAQEILPEAAGLPPPRPERQETTALSSGTAGQIQRVAAAQGSSWRSSGSPSPTVIIRTNLFHSVVEDNLYETFLSRTVSPQASMSTQVTAQAPAAGSLSNIGTFKIGAAGELFVFERLKTLDLPQFGIENWKSKIRTYVNVMPEYDLPFQNEVEIADFEYIDISGNFQSFLQTHSHNKFPQWSDLSELGSSFKRLNLQGSTLAELEATSIGSDDDEDLEEDTIAYANRQTLNKEPIKFLIEVKSTPGPCETPFIVSRNQYSHMNEHRVRLGMRPSTIYVIIRVYDLFTTDIKYKIFVDPWNLRDRMLQFTTDHYEVVGPLCNRDDRT